MAGMIVDPDGRDDFRNGIHAILDDSPRPEDAWGAIGAWAWGASLFVDYLEKSALSIDSNKVVLVGHSRGGKTALWAAANDPRFAMAVSNNSGCTGASLARHRAVGAETIAQINTRFPHWFCRNYRRFNDREEALPVDQHMLLALIAPRTLYVASASHDFWAEPEKEYLATCEAAKVWSKVYGDETMEAFDPLYMPETDTPIIQQGGVGYHIRINGRA